MSERTISTESETCSLCERDVPRELITRHHLRPKQQGGRAEHRTPLCRPCHKQIHAVYSNKTLARSLDRIDLLSEVVDWVEQGEVPERPIASRSDGSASRPLCHYPAYPHYTGGDASKPDSFTCRAPSAT